MTFTKFLISVKKIYEWINEQGVQGLQAFAFCVLAINDEHTKKNNVQKKTYGLNMAKVPNCVSSSSLKATLFFVILLSKNVFGSDCPGAKFQIITF